MPLVHPTSVVSFSSEDPNHPANNLLNRETYRKWKCKDVGEKEGFVILKFDKAVQFTGLDIGNESSAFVSVYVGRSGGEGEVKFEVLLNNSIFLGANDSRSLKNPCGVRSFTINSFDKETASQKWDLVKIVVSQDFNKQVQFGLTFIKFMVTPDPDAPAKIGIFNLRKPLGLGDDDEEAEEEEVPSRIGAMFAKSLANKEQQKLGSENETNSAIREVTKAISGASSGFSEDLVKEVLKRQKLDSPSSVLSHIKKSSTSTSTSTSVGQQLSSSPSQNKNGSSNASAKLPSRNKLADSPLNKKEQKSNQSQGLATPTSSSSPSGQGSSVSGSGIGSSRSGPSSNLFGGTKIDDADADADKPHKPFDKLFEGVVFVMSGFQNPYRKNLRDRAIEMGAKCKPDWDSSCTHLICAFVNTPKFREVRSAGNNGKIVRKEWIERCYGARVRFPWRRFCLDRTDKGAESEDEILAEEGEEIQDGNGRMRIRVDEESSQTNNNGSKSEELDTKAIDDDDHQDSREREEDEQGFGHKKRKRALPLDDEDEVEKKNEHLDIVDADLEDLYNADTDIDEPVEGENISSIVQETRTINTTKSPKQESDGESTDFEEDPLNPTTNEDDEDGGFFLQTITFFLFCPKGTSFNEKDRIEQIISKRKGRLEKELKEEVDYLITDRDDWDEAFSEALSDNPNLVVVNSAWILKCEADGKLVGSDEFMITPS